MQLYYVDSYGCIFADGIFVGIMVYLLGSISNWRNFVRNYYNHYQCGKKVVKMKNCWMDGKTFVITGASSGLGRALAVMLAQRNDCKIIGIGRNEPRLCAVKEELGERFRYYVFDVTQQSAWAAFAHTCATEGIELDGLIQCAGILPRFGKATSCTNDEVEKVMQTNFFSAVYAVNALLPLMKKLNLIHICSSAALGTIVGTAGYTASKSALKSYTEALIYENKKKAYIALVMPGFAKTESFDINVPVLNRAGLYSVSVCPVKRWRKKFIGELPDERREWLLVQMHML